MAATIHSRAKGKLLAYDGPVIYALRNHEAVFEASDLPNSVALIETLIERHPAVAMLMVVEQGTAQPNAEERREMQATLARFGDRLIVGYAFCGLGFWASALRVVLAGISRLAGSPVIAHGTVADTAAHLARELVGLDPELMTPDCEALREELAASLPSMRASG